MLLVCVLNVGPQCLEFAKMLSLVHNRGSDVFDKGCRDILRHQTFMPGQCTVKVLGDAIRTASKNLFVSLRLVRATKLANSATNI